MIRGERLRGILPFLAGAATAFAGALLVRPGVGASSRQSPAATAPDPFGKAFGRGNPGKPPSAASLTAGYETDDANARLLVGIIAVFALCAIAGIGLMVFYLSLLHQRDAARDTGLTAEQRVQTAPPLPHLQADPVGELAALQASQNALLLGYARLDDKTARIPIDRAMALIIGQSLDAHAAPERPSGRRP